MDIILGIFIGVAATVLLIVGGGYLFVYIITKRFCKTVKSISDDYAEIIGSSCDKFNNTLNEYVNKKEEEVDYTMMINMILKNVMKKSKK